VLNGHSDSVYSLAVLQDGSLASGSHDNTIRIWDAKSDQTTKVLNGHSDWVYSLAVLQDGSLASGSHDNTILIWDTKAGQSTKVLNGHSSYVYSLAPGVRPKTRPFFVYK
jgi:WD40 repeat protein